MSLWLRKNSKRNSSKEEVKMNHLRILLLVMAIMALGAIAANGQTIISLQISGEGAIDQSTIKAGKPVSVDVYWENKDDDRRGFTTGFKISSDDIKTIVHVTDSGNGENAAGDVKAYNHFGGAETWDFIGLQLVTVNWDGALPDVIGFGGLRVRNRYDAHENRKVLSWDMMVPETGEITIDSSYWPPSGIWAIVGPDGNEIRPEWKGPYTFEVVE